MMTGRAAKAVKNDETMIARGSEEELTPLEKTGTKEEEEPTRTE